MVKLTIWSLLFSANMTYHIKNPKNNNKNKITKTKHTKKKATQTNKRKKPQMIQESNQKKSKKPPKKPPKTKQNAQNPPTFVHIKKKLRFLYILMWVLKIIEFLVLKLLSHKN